MDATLLVRDAVLPDGRRVDVAIVGDSIASVEPAGTVQPGAGTVLDGRGTLLSPSFVEGHIRLDKTLLGLPLIRHRPGADEKRP